MKENKNKLVLLLVIAAGAVVVWAFVGRSSTPTVDSKLLTPSAEAASGAKLDEAPAKEETPTRTSNLAVPANKK